MFLFYCYGHHRYLHSFPTRRSSDLLSAALIYRLVVTRSSRMARSDSECSSTELFAALTRCVPAAPSTVMLDRKSTRLNSSHGYISYAVFCLKKKKKNTKPTFLDASA